MSINLICNPLFQLYKILELKQTVIYVVLYVETGF